MKKQLGDIAEVTVGHSFRSRLEQEPSGDVAVVQMKDLSQENRLVDTGLVRISMGKINPRHLLRANDIVFRARGLTNTAVHIDRDIGPAVVAAPLLRIRISDSAIAPDYLAWWINHPKMQAYMVREGRGTTQRMISVPVLKGLEVEIPSLKKQHQIVELAELAQEEQKLLCTLADRRARYVEGILMQSASEAR